MERAYNDMASLRSNVEDLPVEDVPMNLQQLYGAPAGSVTLFTPNVTDFATGVLTPSDEGAVGNAALPVDCAFSPQLQEPLR